MSIIMSFLPSFRVRVHVHGRVAVLVATPLSSIVPSVIYGSTLSYRAIHLLIVENQGSYFGGHFRLLSDNVVSSYIPCKRSVQPNVSPCSLLLHIPRKVGQRGGRASGPRGKSLCEVGERGGTWRVGRSIM